jgi:hypothetical protein
MIQFTGICSEEWSMILNVISLKIGPIAGNHAHATYKPELQHASFEEYGISHTDSSK